MTEKPDKSTMSAASWFLARARAAVEDAEAARTERAAEALYKEAETWLYMANRCLAPQLARRPASLEGAPRRAAGERRSFSAEE